MANNTDGSLAEHVVLVIAESLRWSHDDTVTSVDTERIKVLHVTDFDAVVHGIYLVLDFLPSM